MQHRKFNRGLNPLQRFDFVDSDLERNQSAFFFLVLQVNVDE